MVDASIAINNVSQSGDTVTVRVQVTEFEDPGNSYSWQVDILGNGAGTLGFDSGTRYIDGFEWWDVEIPVDLDPGQSINADVYASISSPVADSESTSFTITGPDPAEIDIVDVDTYEDGIDVEVETSNVGAAQSSEIDVAINEGSMTWASDRVTRTGSVSHTFSFDNLGIPRGDSIDVYVDANLLEPNSDFDSTQATIDGPPGVELRIWDVFTSPDLVEVIVHVENVSSSENVVVDVAINDGSNTLASEQMSGLGEDQFAFGLNNLGLSPGETRSVYVDVNLLEPVALFASEVVTIEGPDPQFDPGAISVSCSGLPSEVSVNQEFSVTANVQNGNQMSATGDIQLVANGSVIGEAQDVSVPGGGSRSVSVPGVISSGGQASPELQPARWSEN